jgi:hypothetical protein
MTARTRITALVTTVVAVAAGANVASAAHGPGSVASSSTVPSGVEELQDARLGPKFLTPHVAEAAAPSATQGVDALQDARLGPKFYVAPNRAPSASAEPTIVQIPSTGFDWHDASIGAGITAAALAAAAAAAVFTTRRRHHHTPLRT